MGITVRDALQLSVFRTARLVAGKLGLDREVLYVDVVEVPDINGWLRPNTMLMTTAFAIKNDPQKQEELVKVLAEMGAAALLVKPGRFIDTIPQKVLEIGDELDFPIIELPLETPYIEVINAVLGIILDQQSALIKWGEELHKKLTETVLKGGGLGQIASTLARIIKNPVFIEDEEWKLLAYSAKEEQLKTFCSIRKNTNHLNLVDFKTVSHIVLTGEGKIKQVAAPIWVGSKRYGTVTILNFDDYLEEFQVTAVEHTATVAALEMMKQKAVWETEIRLQREFIDDLLLGSFEDETLILKRARYLGWDLTKEFSILNVDIDDFEQYSNRREVEEEDLIQQLKDGIFTLVKKIVSRYEKQPIVAHRSDSFVVLLDVGYKKDKHSLNSYTSGIGEEIGREVRANFPDLSVSVGIGRPYGQVAQLSKGYQEARQALKIGRTVWGKGNVYHFNELGIYRLLLTHQGEKDLGRFFEDFLQPLVVYDQQNGTELVNTLEQYFHHNYNIQSTANHLFLHRNTLNYRLRRIREILSLDLDNPEDRLCLEMAIKIKNVLEL